MIEKIIPAILRPILGNRVYWDTTPNKLEKTPDGTQYLAFAIVQEVGDRNTMYLDKQLADKTYSRVQIVVVAPDPIGRKILATQILTAMVFSAYQVEVYDGSVGGYDDSRQLFSRTQQFGIWFDRPIA